MARSKHQLKTVKLDIPVTREAIASLEIGTVAYLNGVIYTGREGVYKRMLDDGIPPPTDLKTLSNVNFHCSPAASVDENGSYNIGGVTCRGSSGFKHQLY